ncbi:GNAT family N-acetyltransferase [Candidatus Bipolaricaulota bacterium]|jgi:ribosomal protein S18 acetylase RimI-like enzyme|nr:GNAT family N-acetyltransferase [Candidatus Bipolaricaulota bacterium]TFH09624.1 MAG: GNAT family N-acetyltransferase [Candidatus Atribacteria bacterium]
MSQSDITIRQARPTLDEGLKFASYMNSASNGGFAKLFGKRFEEIISNAYLEPNHDLSYETALFAEVDGTIVGMISGYTAEQYQAFSKDVVKRFAGRSKLRIALIYAMIAPMMRFLHTYDDGDFYVEFLAVDEAQRGQGIGSKLLQALEDRARATQSTQFAIDVAAHNKVARRLYERHGFAMVARWPRTRIVSPNILRMTKPLSLRTQGSTSDAVN